MVERQNITNLEEVRDFFRYLYNTRRVAFHPDDSFDSYVSDASDEPTFTPDECKHFDRLMEQCFDVCEKEGADIYELGMELSPLFQNV